MTKTILPADTYIHTDFQPPRYASPVIYNRTRGLKVAAFAHDHLTVHKGPLVGNPLNLLNWQRWLFDRILEVNPEGRLRYRRGLVGVSRQVGKSVSGSALALHGLFTGPPGTEVYSVAGDRKQARIVFDAAKKYVLASEYLSSLVNVYKDALEVMSTGSIYRTLSADAKLAQGLSPSLVLFDELHVQANDDLWDAMTLGTGARLEPLVLAITTAGEDPESLCGRLYDYGKQVALGEIEDETFGFWWWEAPADCDVQDHDAWKQANPSYAEGFNYEAATEDFATAARQQTEASFRRYRLNQWVPMGGLGWMDMEAYDDCVDDTLQPLPAKGAPIVIAFDGSVSHDGTSITVVDCGDAEIPAVYQAGLWEPTQQQVRDGDWQVPREEVHGMVDHLFDQYDVRALFADPAWWRSELQVWQAKYGEKVVMDWPVTNARMAPAVMDTYKRIKERKIRISRHAGLRRHVSQAVEHVLPLGGVVIRKEKKGSHRLIDAAVTMCMAVDAFDRFGQKRRVAKLHTF